MHWLRISLLLCVIGFLKEFKPSEPFFVDFMQQPYRHVTTEELNRYVLATNIYVNGFLSVVILFVTDFVRYKPIIILIGLSGVLTWGTLIWTKSFMCTQLVEIFYSMYVTTEVAFFAYIYAKVPKQHYLTVTSHTRAALMTGKFLAGLMGQLLLFGNILNMVELNYISFGALIAVTIIALCLPKAQRSIYFYRQNGVDCVEINNTQDIDMDPDIDKTDNTEPCIVPLNRYHAKSVGQFQSGYMVIRKQFICAYSNRQVVLWSIWYACGLCGYLQILTFVQLLWNEIDNRQEVRVKIIIFIFPYGYDDDLVIEAPSKPKDIVVWDRANTTSSTPYEVKFPKIVSGHFLTDLICSTPLTFDIRKVIWNGAVDSTATLLSAIMALLASRLHENEINTKEKVLWSLFTMSLCSGGSIFLMANTTYRFISYAGYITFYMFYIFTITIASAEIAKQLPEDSYGLIFGINTCIAYWIQIILSLTVATDVFSLSLSIFVQFNIYGTFFVVLGCVYFILILNKCPVFHRKKEIDRNKN